MFALLIAWLPLINLICVLILAFTGTNETKKNFYKAILWWVLLLILIHVSIILFLGWPQILEFIRDATDFEPGGTGQPM